MDHYGRFRGYISVTLSVFNEGWFMHLSAVDLRSFEAISQSTTPMHTYRHELLSGTMKQESLNKWCKLILSQVILQQIKCPAMLLT